MVNPKNFQNSKNNTGSGFGYCKVVGSRNFGNASMTDMYVKTNNGLKHYNVFTANGGMVRITGNHEKEIRGIFLKQFSARQF